jgi:hypothetical protein
VGTLACRLIVAKPEGIIETLACALDLMIFCEFVPFAYISYVKLELISNTSYISYNFEM